MQVTCIKINWTVRPPSVLNSRESTWSYVKLNTIIIELREIYALEQGQSDTRRAQTVWDNVNAKKKTIFFHPRHSPIDHYRRSFWFCRFTRKKIIKTWRNFIVSIPTSQLTTSKKIPIRHTNSPTKAFHWSTTASLSEMQSEIYLFELISFMEIQLIQVHSLFRFARILCDEKNEEKEILSSLKPSRVSRKELRTRHL